MEIGILPRYHFFLICLLVPQYQGGANTHSTASGGCVFYHRFRPLGTLQITRLPTNTSRIPARLIKYHSTPNFVPKVDFPQSIPAFWLALVSSRPTLIPDSPFLHVFRWTHVVFYACLCLNMEDCYWKSDYHIVLRTPYSEVFDYFWLGLCNRQGTHCEFAVQWSRVLLCRWHLPLVLRLAWAYQNVIVYPRLVPWAMVMRLWIILHCTVPKPISWIYLE